MVLWNISGNFTSLVVTLAFERFRIDNDKQMYAYRILLFIIEYHRFRLAIRLRNQFQLNFPFLPIRLINNNCT